MGGALLSAKYGMMRRNSTASMGEEEANAADRADGGCASIGLFQCSR